MDLRVLFGLLFNILVLIRFELLLVNAFIRFRIDNWLLDFDLG